MPRASLAARQPAAQTQLQRPGRKHQGCGGYHTQLKTNVQQPIGPGQQQWDAWEAGMKETCQSGVIAGFPMIDVKVTMVDCDDEPCFFGFAIFQK